MARKQKKFHYIYKTVCKTTKKYYIGMHSTDDLNDGYLGSGKRLWYSRKKYGDKDHIKEILEFCKDRNELKQREKEIVNKDLLEQEMCMNLIEGGEGGRGFTSEEQRENARRSNEKQKLLMETDPEWLKKFKDNCSKAQKKAYQEGTKKRYHFYDWTGKQHKEESKKKIGKANSLHQQGKKNSQYGTVWITKDGQTKKILKEELRILVQDGWKRGRK